MPLWKFNLPVVSVKIMTLTACPSDHAPCFRCCATDPGSHTVPSRQPRRVSAQLGTPCKAEHEAFYQFQIAQHNRRPKIAFYPHSWKSENQKWIQIVKHEYCWLFAVCPTTVKQGYSCTEVNKSLRNHFSFCYHCLSQFSVLPKAFGDFSPFSFIGSQSVKKILKHSTKY